MPGPLRSAATLDGYPQGVGDRYISLVDHKGPASYVQLAVATPPTGGDVLTAAECGLKFIDAVSGQLSDDGQYAVEATETVGAGGEVVQVRLAWLKLSTGLQEAGATNLSARTVRLVVWGR